MLSNIAGMPGRGGLEALKGVGAVPVRRLRLHRPHTSLLRCCEQGTAFCTAAFLRFKPPVFPGPGHGDDA